MKNLDYSKFLKKKRCVIFLFHGVCDDKNYQIINYTKKHIKKARFLKILKKLNKKGKCITINNVLWHIENNIDFPDYSYVISFDDGFYNNYKIAFPILKNLKIPAVFYITYNFINNNLSSWIDQIEYIIENSKSGQFDTEIGKISFINTKQSKIKLLKFIRKKVKMNKKIDPYNFAKSIAKKLNYKKPFQKLSFSIFRKMSWKNIIFLNKQKLITIGGHYTDHRILKFLKKKDLEKNILKSIRGINSKLKKKIIHYSYPEGMPGTFGKREIKLLKSQGIKICPTAIKGVNSKNTDLFYLKRVNVI